MRPVLALYVGGMGSREQNFYNAAVSRFGFADAAQRCRTSTSTGSRRRPPRRCPTS